ncbi:keratin associated protein [Enhygromyxa salina]|uniref:Keratin associated protein n=1 Tax=Enhygromyxa salina TaxID=215803 RepID=A0A0C2DG09_9BACT|nr:hypothetical protein [Enhygromyxa salina]KIG18622.1 keratin associated protein [Enhygromyxa salina]
MVDIQKKPYLPFLACGLISGIAIASPGCDAVGDLAEQCGLVCPDTGILEGNASISGSVSIDAFFGAVVDVRTAALDVSGTIRAQLEGIAASLEIEGYADLSLDDLTAAVTAGLEAKFTTTLEGGISITFEPPKCEANVELAVSAAAECDIEADPGSIEAKCMGSCEVSAEVAAECEASGTLECTGQAPSFECSGSCSGSCQLEVAAECGGTCQGTCEGECSSCTGGTCNTDGNGNITNCNGSCSSMCQGTCELSAGGECSGRCEGECTYMPAMGGCEANATAKCDVSAMADVECQGKCEGSVEPPSVSAECQASVEAKAEANVECTPPSLSVEFQFKGDLDANEEAAFRIWLEGFKGRFSAMLAASAKLERVGVAAQGLISASGGAVADVAGDLSVNGNLKLKIGAVCAIAELKNVSTALGEATGAISGSVSAVASVSGAVGG